jgi:acetate kinase
MIAVLDGVDLVVFTGGIGEHDAAVRAAICSGLAWIGVTLDARRNGARSNPISDSASRCAVRVLTSQEDEEIARHTWTLASTSLA